MQWDEHLAVYWSVEIDSPNRHLPQRLTLKSITLFKALFAQKVSDLEFGLFLHHDLATND